jgi:hypothetical protein
MNLKEQIIEAKNILGEKAAHIIAEDLHIEKWDVKGLKGCCPFHKEDTGSFIWNKKDNHFKCFGCGVNYGILDHYQKQGIPYLEAVKKLFETTNIIFDNNYIELNNKNDYFKDYKYPKEETNENRIHVEEYLGKRGISQETLNFAYIKEDLHENIVFEHRDISGKLLATKYRPSRAIKKGENMMWWQKNSSTCPVLYGIDKIDITKPLLITEGHIDRLSCIESGFTNVVSIPHGANDLQWIEFNWEFLENFDVIILYFDNDEPGQKAIKESIVRIGEHRCKIVEPDSEIENKVREFWKEYKHDIKKTDANNVLLACGKQELLNLINNAKEVPIPDVAKLMDCEEFDITKADVLPTGTSDLDSHIYGYVEGTLNIWTGRTGGGKSTYIIESCINEAIDLGYPTFVYSGELTSSQLKNWVILQLAGRDHLIEWNNGDSKPKTYTVTNDAKKHIEDKYRDLLYIYDSYLIATPEKVISRMEYMRKKHGVKNFIIDNLMCLELDIVKHGNELNAQKNLIIQFLQFAVRYNAIVHLVAHPRKPNGQIAVDEYDILGSSNIPNLAHRIFALKRTTKEDKAKGIAYDAYVSILKDRILGVNKKDVGLYYDVPSRRMYGDKDKLNKKYSWDTGKIQYKNTRFGNNGQLLQTVISQEKEVFG